MSSLLFSPLRLGSLEVPNRIAVAPMCQYSAEDGAATDWHLQHLTTLGMSGAGLVVIEATAVERRGRITHGCLGLYSDACEDALARVLLSAKRYAVPGTAFGIQLGHAGRKASSQRPWEGGGALKAHEDPWPTIAPSAIPFGDGWHTPAAFTEEDAEQIVQAFEQAARRAVRIGLNAIELHMAHGYLMHTIVSPISNHRTDQFGGSRENRMRLPLEIARRVRAIVPDNVALGARITGQDWLDGGWTLDDAAALATALKQAGLEFVCVSSGGVSADNRVKVGPGYQVPFARHVREKTGMVTRAVGMIVRPEQAEDILASGAADQIALARAFLDDPRWGWHAAEALGDKLSFPRQYARVSASLWPGAALARPA
jgi:2,4-dienoyl-CoA reductase-like NADH-dependent reductase (Old Yellow Enzyme family)